MVPFLRGLASGAAVGIGFEPEALHGVLGVKITAEVLRADVTGEREPDGKWPRVLERFEGDPTALAGHAVDRCPPCRRASHPTNRLCPRQAALRIT
jgi:hypothetical protein